MIARSLALTLPLSLALALALSGCNTGSRGEGGAPPPPPVARVAGALQTPRADHAVAHLSSGLLLVSGGETLSEQASASAELFDTRAGSGRALGALLNEARAGHVAAPVSGSVLILGGRDAAGRGLQTVERYLAEEERFEPLDALLLAPRVGSAVSVEPTRVVFAGGRGQRSVEVFDLEGLTSARALELPEARTGAQLLRLEDELYLLYGGAQAPAAQALWLDLAAGSVTPVGPIEDLELKGPAATRLPEGGILFAAPQEPGVAWLVSGTWKGKDNRGVLRLEREVPPRFLRGQPGPASPRAGAIGLAHPDGSLSVFGGTWAGQAVGACERIYPRPSALPTLSDGRSELCALALPEGELALVGGRESDGRPSALVDVFLPAGSAQRDASAAYREAEAERAATRERRGALDQERQGLAQSEASAAALRAELAQVEEALAGVEAEVQRLEAALQSSRTATQDAQAEVSRLTQAVAQAQVDLTQAQAQATGDAQALAAAQARLRAAQQARTQAQADAQVLAGRANGLQGQLEGAAAEARRLSSRASSIRIELF